MQGFQTWVGGSPGVLVQKASSHNADIEFIWISVQKTTTTNIFVCYDSASAVSRCWCAGLDLTYFCLEHTTGITKMSNALSIQHLISDLIS